MKHFKAELEKGQSYNPPNELETNSLYELEHAYAHLRASWARSSFKVRVVQNQKFDCECGHFGILCRHVLRLMIHLGITQIPDHHIMKRWTKSARDILGPLAFEGSEGASVSLPRPFRHNIMYVSALELVKMGDRGEHQYRTVMKYITACKKELRDSEAEADPLYYSSECEGGGSVAERSAAKTTQLPGMAEIGAVTSDGVVIKEPLVQKSRGRPKMTRMKSFMDSGAKKASKGTKRANQPEGLSKQTTFCKLCRLPGHNSASCSLNPGYEGETEGGRAVKKPRRKNRCRNCQVLGHNSATWTKDVAS